MKARAIAFSTKGCATAKRIAEALAGEDVTLCAKTSSDVLGLVRVELGMREWTERAFAECDAVIFVGAIGIAVREIAPFVRSKDTDPAVISVDELGRFSVPVLSGHIGGANALAIRIAAGIGAVPVVTTATDINGKIAIDTFAAVQGMSIASLHTAKEVASRILAGAPVGFVSDYPVRGEVPSELSSPEGSPTGVYVGSDPERRPFTTTLRLIPRDRVLGIGCRRGISENAIEEAVSSALAGAGIRIESVRAVASIDLKRGEEGLLAFASRHRLPITFHSAAELNSLAGDFSGSEFVRSVTGADCVCERAALAASRGGVLEMRKRAGGGVTVASAREPFVVDFTGLRG
ncbi:cobalt-precorrin 5A hydrolase [Methanomassiliicoccaceae archaeon COG_1]|nr:cobalt-precorrin 5A hydrolase [Methanomassiliicoccaceae archaeon COG_1]